MAQMTVERIEKAIARAIVKSGLAAGYQIAVDNGGDEFEIGPTNKAREILGAMFATDSDRLYFFKNGHKCGWVWLVYGNNGWDVVCDYTGNMEAIMGEADRLSEKYG